MERTDDKWHSSRSPNPLQFKNFEAIVQDSTGKQYAIAAYLGGNRYMYEAHAWLANTDDKLFGKKLEQKGGSGGRTPPRWYEIYKETPEVESRGPDVWTKDRRLAYTGNMSAGWQIKVKGTEAAFEVMSIPERPVSQYSVAGSSADFSGYISFRTKVDGKIVIDDQDIHVSGFGYCMHTFGDMGKHILWRYIGFRDEKLCITAMNAQFDTDRLNMFVTVDSNMRMNQYSPDKVSWEEIDQNTWRVSAAFTGGSAEPKSQSDPRAEEQNGTRIDMIVRLVKPRPTNKDQPYSKYSLGFVTFSKTILHEYLAEVHVKVADPGLDEPMELQSIGIATEFDLVR